jgi:hypothetical protein
MAAYHRQSDRWGRTAWAGVLAAASIAVAGCAAGPGQSWADFRSRRAINELAADDSFPSAAEVGLNTADEKPDDRS